jgi:SWI/SNF-related matrix-associated actin-dependent regulator of chromatin subfamily A-like protein 1
MTPIQTLSERSTPETVGDAAKQLGRGLYPHQVEGVAFLLGRHRAILADDMGLGKTRQAIVALRHVAPDGPWLVVCPASVKQNWAREIALVDENLLVHIIGPESAPTPDWTGFVVINYDVLKRHQEALAQLPFAGFVFDEAHYLKNQTSQRSKAGIALVNARPDETPVYALSGTPLTSRPRDLFVLLNVIRHPMARSFLSFAKRYCAATHNGFGWVTDGASNLEELAVQLQGAMLRRTKDEVLDLPPKLRSWVPVSVPNGPGVSEMRAVVQDLVRSQSRQAGGRAGTDAAEVAGSTGADRIRLVARITKARNAIAKAKVKATVDLVDSAVQQGEKVLVFSCFDAPVKAIAKHFGDAAVTLTGATPTTKRQTIVDRFQCDNDVRVLVANLIAGGVGLNLTAARHVVFNDLDWVPTNHWQAEDRAYRIGQTATVNVHYLVGERTVEEFVQAVLERKAALIDAVIDGRATEVGGGVLEELERLLSAMSPGLANVRDSELTEADVDALVDDARQRLRSEGREMELPIGSESDPAQMDRALSTLVRALTAPAASRYRVTSNSRPGAFYDMEIVGGDVICACPGFEYRGACTHTRKLKVALASGRPLPAGYSSIGPAS